MTILEKFNLTGKVALVTGGAGLLGTEFCHTLVQAGAQVVVVDLNHSVALKVCQDLEASGQSSLALATDITDPKAVKGMLTAILERFGRLDILVNSAALDPKFDPEHEAPGASGAFEDYPLEAWKQALDVNLTGMFLVSQAAVKPMLAQGRGAIINVCSMYGLVGPDQRLYQRKGQAPRYKPVYYSVTKSGVLGFTKYLATYYAGKNIRVNALTPGGVFNGHDETFLQEYATRAVLGRMAEKDEMNGALLFLASEASAYMTGANLVVDGGWTAW
jgi:NAD(P)-dependent dehydrogenase (short-subunit alcohol dehydrogenase family)